MAEGSATTARAIATRCCSPPLSWRGKNDILDVKPTLASISSTFATCLYQKLRFGHTDGEVRPALDVS
jgi:hypothetical protein